MKTTKAVLFDLDGTLIPMDQKGFTIEYFKLITETFTPLGYEPKQLMEGVWKGTDAMLANDGRESNETVFWRRFAELCGDRVYGDKPAFDEFYRTEFQKLRPQCGFEPKSAGLIQGLKEKGLRLVVATNPIFPLTAMECRVRWAGLDPSDFEFITGYEISSFCKPNPLYYTEIAGRLGLPPEECLMIGNDATEDMVARTVGMDVFLLTNGLLNRDNLDITQFPHGEHEQLASFIEELHIC